MVARKRATTTMGEPVDARKVRLEAAFEQFTVVNTGDAGGALTAPRQAL